jgi:exonuclease III
MVANKMFSCCKLLFIFLSYILPFIHSLRIMQYNTEWLFIDYYPNMDCPGNGCTWHNESEAKTHMTKVSNVIRSLNPMPDIINICEVEGTNELTMLNSMLEYNSFLIKGTDTSTGQNVGMLSNIEPLVSLYRSEERIKYPIVGTKCGNTTASGTMGVSKHYITEFQINNLQIAMIGVHLLAIPTDPTRCVEREAQSQVIQNIVSLYVEKNYEVIVIGDMNDYDGDTLDINSNKPISRVLNILKGLEGEKMKSYVLYNVADKLTKNDRYSDWWDSDNNCNTKSQSDLSMIDHILVTQNIYNKITNVSIYHDYDIYCGKMDSDHWPVIIDISE